MAPADDALKFIENSKAQKNFSSDTNLSDIVGDLSQSNKSLDMIPEKSQNVTTSSDNNNFIEAKNVACNKNFIKLEQQLNKNEVGSSSEILQHDAANKKFAKEIDELAKIYHEDNEEINRAASCTNNNNNNNSSHVNNDIINANIIDNKNANDDAGEDADDEDEFERVFENSMHDLEQNRDNYESSSGDESDFEYSNNIPSLQKQQKNYDKKIKSVGGNIIHNIISGLPSINQSGGINIETSPIKIITTPANRNTNRIRFEKVKEKNNEKNASDISDSDEDGPDKIIDEIAKSPKLLPNEIINNHKMFLFRPYSLPFQERRRLSQCKEEDENEDNDNNKLLSQKSDSAVGSNTSGDAGNHTHNSRREKNSYMHIRSPPVPESQLMSEKFKELERLRDQFRRKLEEIHPSTIAISTLSIIDDTINNTNQLISTNKPNSKIYKGKFTVTRAEDPSVQIIPVSPDVIIKPEKEVLKLRSEAIKLTNLQPQMNSFTIHFPNSKGISGHTRIQNLFSTNSDDEITQENINRGDLKRHTVSFQPHLDKQFFDTSLVEIRPISDSTKSLDNCDSIVEKPFNENSVWIPRPSNSVTPASSKTSIEDPDGSKSAGPSRPSSAPAEPNAKAARKASKKMEKEARRQEKELRTKEKEARKRLEREQAKLEKLNRNSEKMARSTERLAPRSGSLERRRSGEDSPVLNQSTVHGIASPNRRPTIFDVFRPRTKSDAKRKEKDAALHSGSEKDNSSTSSNHSGSGGIMKAMKHAVQNTVGHHRHPTTEKPSVKYRDGSAHPHPGSDAQYYHTVTAVRRADVSRSPMTKVMDLFRYRSNSAVNEADKRKARAVAHQQLLAAQIGVITVVVLVEQHLHTKVSDNNDIKI